MNLPPEAVLQIALLMVLAVFLPFRLARLLPWRLPMVLVNLALSALLLWVIGMALLALPYFGETGNLGDMIRLDPTGAALWLARLGALPALAWAPLVALSGFVIAQRIAQNPGRGGRL